MTIANEITKLNTNLTDSYTACENKGATMPTDQNFDNLSDCINSITTGSTPVISSLNVTPTTQAQEITAPTGTDGYSPVNVAAVTSAIDENITAGNIKDGVTILGVTGTVEEANNTTLAVTPSTSAQSLTPTSPYTGFNEVNVSAVTSSIDNNITSGNIKKDVTILGVTGSYEGTTPTLTTKNITVNGTYNASSDDADGYSSVTVSVPSMVTNAYIPLEVAIDNALQKPTTNFVWVSQGETIWDAYVLAYAFAYCTGITGANLSSLVNIYGIGALAGAFYHCQNLTSVDLSNLTTIDSYEDSALTGAFSYCTSLTTLSFPSLTTVTPNTTFRNMLQGVTGCTVHFPSNLQSVIGSWTDVVSGFGGTNTTVLFDL